MTLERCPLCDRIALGDFEEHAAATVAFSDGFPLSNGHTLVVPRRHVANLFDLTAAELQEILDVVARVRARLAGQRSPDGFNIGVNVGAAAGQTVPHAHVHVIPRYLGDVADPRGGVRWVLPGKAAYWKAEKDG